RDIEAVGHPGVHGGDRFSKSVKIDPVVLRAIAEMIDPAPLHNPHNLNGIAALRETPGDAPQAAGFDTTFHQTLPPHASPSAAAAARLPVRDSVLALPSLQGPALRLPRDVSPLRRIPLPAADRAHARAHQPDHDPPGQRLLRLRDPRR